MPSKAQMTANQANAQKSTGVAKNALKTGLTGRTVLLPGDDAGRYAELVASFRARFNPVGDAETELVQRMIDSTWRLDRIASLEAGIFAIGRLKMTDLHTDVEDEQMRSDLIHAEIYLAYEKQFRNLQIQEGRLRRNLEKDMAALLEMQTQRQEQEPERLAEAAAIYQVAIERGQAEMFNPADFGFEFSKAEVEAELSRLNPELMRSFNEKAA